MKSIIKIITGLSLFLAMYTPAISQQSGYADISISSLTLGSIYRATKVVTVSQNATTVGKPMKTTNVPTDTLKCSITLTNSSNRTAITGKLVVVLPAEVTVVPSSLSNNAKQVNERGVMPWPGYVEFDYLFLGPNQQMTLEFTFQKSPLSNKVSAFVFTSIPDANPFNNYKEATY